jgi:hypothetical protein
MKTQSLQKGPFWVFLAKLNRYKWIYVLFLPVFVFAFILPNIFSFDEINDCSNGNVTTVKLGVSSKIERS